MFQFPGFAPVSQLVHGLQPCGLPHSDIRGSIPVCKSPRLIAAYHVLLRLRIAKASSVRSSFLFPLFSGQAFRPDPRVIFLPQIKLQSLISTFSSKKLIFYSYRLSIFALLCLFDLFSQYCQGSFYAAQGRKKSRFFSNGTAKVVTIF